ncbi:MAG: cell envelope integrity protein CreD, partial [Chitinophagales bacterium]|nr:cell envelope integrity protein CreD [Chitinophagales bacterium]
TGGKYRFSFDLNLNGSERLHFLPFGEETNLSLSGNWSDPSFEGAYLPEKKNIGTKDFSAEWKVLQLNRNYPQQGTGNFLPPIEISFETEPANFIPNQNRNIGSAGSFGVKLLVPIDEYQKTNRSAKYAVMFIFLTFLTLFFTEILSRRLIHPIQYLLIGFGIVLFYVLLLSISEHIKFGWAYLIASAAITLLITYYAWNMLRQRFLTAVVGGVVLVLYVFYYSLLQLEQYALLLGSIGLLVILATVMYLTRNINWYDLYSNNDKSDK